MGNYPCVNSQRLYIYFFNLIIELISCDLLCLFTGAVVRCYETKRKLFQQSLPENRKKAAQTKKDNKSRSGRKRVVTVSPLLVQYDF